MHSIVGADWYFIFIFFCFVSIVYKVEFIILFAALRFREMLLFNLLLSLLLHSYRLLYNNDY